MNQMGGNRPIARKLAIVAAAFGMWGALVLLFAAPLALTTSASWRETISFAASFWALWLIFMPAVAWLSLRFPLERRGILRNIALHLMVCLLVVGFNRASLRYLHRPAPPPRDEAPARPPESRATRLGPPAAFGVFLGLRAALDVLVYGTLLGLCQTITYFRKLQEREQRAVELEASLASAKLQALRMQINPHFLFNTLNSIAGLVYVNPGAADEMLGELSELLRRSLDSMEEQEVPLAQELEFIAAYTGIEQKRFGERLRVEQNVPDELVKALVPALLLQPLVENAIRHGIEPQRGLGLISIVGRKEGERLHLVVQDNGRGLPKSDSRIPSRRGVGLANTRARLQALYGDEQSFSFGRAEPQGCRAVIHLPFHTEPVQLRSSASDAS